MLFMVIENYRNGDAKAIYRRFRDHGRMMPEGLSFIGSWVTADLKRCFLVLESDDVGLVQQWVTAWSDLVDFEIVPVSAGGKAVAEAVASQPDV
jgi:hypothetical protein